MQREQQPRETAKPKSFYHVAFTATPDVQDPKEHLPRNSFTFNSKKEFTFHLWQKPSSEYHKHENYFEIFVVTDGKVIHSFNGQQALMKKGDAFIVLPRQYHSHLQYKDHYSQHINLTCPLPFAASFFKTFFNTDMSECPQQIAHFSIMELEVIENLKELILKAQDENSYISYVQSLLVLVLRIYCRHISAQEQNPESDMPKYLKNFIQHLQKMDMSAPIQMAELYNVSGVSQSKLSREFKKYTGQTLISYVTDLRLNYACNLLKSTSLPVNKISELCGFDNYTSFWRVFKSKYNLNPADYRTSHLNQS